MLFSTVWTWLKNPWIHLQRKLNNISTKARQFFLYFHQYKTLWRPKTPIFDWLCILENACTALIWISYLMILVFSIKLDGAKCFFWLRSKCSICSYQLNIWYATHRVASILNLFFAAGEVLEACSNFATGRPGIAVPPGMHTIPIFYQFFSNFSDFDQFRVNTAILGSRMVESSAADGMCLVYCH